MHRLVSAALAVLLIAGPAWAANQPPLPPGKPAGVKKADDENTEAYWMAGILVVTLAVCTAIIFKSDNNSTTSTSGTSS